MLNAKFCFISYFYLVVYTIQNNCYCTPSSPSLYEDLYCWIFSFHYCYLVYVI